jgi:hypothetical protein
MSLSGMTEIPRLEAKLGLRNNRLTSRVSSFQIATKPTTSIWMTKHQNVIPVKTGIQALLLRRQGTILILGSRFSLGPLDSCFRRNDGKKRKSVKLT